MTTYEVIYTETYSVEIDANSKEEATEIWGEGESQGVLDHSDIKEIREVKP